MALSQEQVINAMESIRSSVCMPWSSSNAKRGFFVEWISGTLVSSAQTIDSAVQIVDKTIILNDPNAKISTNDFYIIEWQRGGNGVVETSKKLATWVCELAQFGNLDDQESTVAIVDAIAADFVRVVNNG